MKPVTQGGKKTQKPMTKKLSEPLLRIKVVTDTAVKKGANICFTSSDTDRYYYGMYDHFLTFSLILS